MLVTSSSFCQRLEELKKYLKPVQLSKADPTQMSSSFNTSGKTSEAFGVLCCKCKVRRIEHYLAPSSAGVHQPGVHAGTVVYR